MATSTTSTMLVKRLQGEVKLLEKNKCDFFQVIQSDTDIRIFYFLLRPRDSSQIDGKAIEDQPYIGGLYIGSITVPDNYPSSPPVFRMLTPSGRFKVNDAICLTNSHYHPEQSSAVWNMYTMTLGMISIFMDDDTTGISHIKDTLQNRKELATNSYTYNCSNFPEIFMKFNYFINDDLSLKSDEEVAIMIAPKKKKKVE